MGQFINSRDTLVTEAIDGFLRGQDGQVSRLDGFPHIKVVVRADWKSDQVAIISGGGRATNLPMLALLERGCSQQRYAVRFLPLPVLRLY